MTILTAEAYYMNPFTGSVDTGENWESEGHATEELEKLIKVKMDAVEDGVFDWVSI